jgi:hypothetical protein
MYLYLLNIGPWDHQGLRTKHRDSDSLVADLDDASTVDQNGKDETADRAADRDRHRETAIC